MNREQIIEKARRALTRSSWPDGGRDGFPGMVVAGMLAPRVVDAILPQVTTVEELEALPPRTLLLVITESGEPATPWWDTDGRGGPVRLWTHDGYPADAEAILDMYPMTVVWSPR